MSSRFLKAFRLCRREGLRLTNTKFARRFLPGDLPGDLQETGEDATLKSPYILQANNQAGGMTRNPIPRRSAASKYKKMFHIFHTFSFTVLVFEHTVWQLRLTTTV